MLKITTQVNEGAVTLGLEGRLVGPWVTELETYWRSESIQQIHHLRVDLSSVIFIDDDGKRLLSSMYRDGAELIATGCLNRFIVEGIVQSVEGGVRA